MFVSTLSPDSFSYLVHEYYLQTQTTTQEPELMMVVTRSDNFTRKSGLQAVLLVDIGKGSQIYAVVRTLLYM